MANKRMFSKAIVTSTKFIKMPSSSQLLYFQLAMDADDEGIVEAYKIMRMINSSEDDLRILLAKGFIKILNDDLLTWIIDWENHNLIRPDRKSLSIYHDILVKYKSESIPCQIVSEMSGKCQATDGQNDTKSQHSIVEYSIDQYSKVKAKSEQSADALAIDELPFITNQAIKTNNHDDIIAEIEQYFINSGGAKVAIKKDTKANMLKVIKDFNLDEIKKVIDFYSKDTFYLSSGFFNLSSLFRPTKFEEKLSRASSAVAIHTTNSKIFNRVKEAYLDSVTNVLCLYITDIDDPTYIIGLPARREYTTPDLINAKLAELGSPLRYNDLPVYDTVEYSKTKGKGMFIPRYNNMENK